MAEFKKADNLLSVSLRKNQFAESSDSYVGSVTRSTVTLENLIAQAAEKNPGLSAYTLQHSALVLGDEMLAATGNGKAVDVLGLGTLCIYVDGSVTGQNPDGSSIPGFRLGFTPSQKTQKVLGSLKVDKVVFSDSTPMIDKIINGFDQNTDLILTKGKGVHIKGSRLKIGGEGSGIWFAPLSSDGNAEKDESKWTAVDSATIGTNQPKHLEFYVPETESMTAGAYFIVIRTRHLGGGRELKNLQTAFSPEVTVK